MPGSCIGAAALSAVTANAAVGQVLITIAAAMIEAHTFAEIFFLFIKYKILLDRV